MRKLGVVCLLAREPGWRCLKRLVEEKDRFDILAIMSHKNKPSSEDPNRGPRADFGRFEECAHDLNVPFGVVDSYRGAEELSELKMLKTYDILVSCNWKYLIPEWAFCKASLGGINLHRGKLPDYRGLEPVKRALENKDTKVTLSSHRIEEEYDTGEVIAEVSIPAIVGYGELLDQAVERIKTELYPWYPEVMMKSIDKMMQGAKIS